MHPLVSVVIPTRNRKERLLACLQALADQTYPASRFEVVVVDDASTDSTFEAVEEWIRAHQESYRVNLLRIATNRGPAAARNAGIAASNTEMIAFIDDDCLPEKSWLEKLVNVVANKSFGGVGGQVHLLTDQNKSLAATYMLQHHWFGKIPMQNGEPDFLLTANCAYTREAIERVGGFDESFLSAGGEDTDLGRRVRAAGFELSYTGDAIVYHPTHTSLIRLLRSAYTYGIGAGMIAFRFPNDVQSAHRHDLEYSRRSTQLMVMLKAVDKLVRLASRWGFRIGFRRAKINSLRDKPQ